MFLWKFDLGLAYVQDQPYYMTFEGYIIRAALNFCFLNRHSSKKTCDLEIRNHSYRDKLCMPISIAISVDQSTIGQNNQGNLVGSFKVSKALALS